MVFAIKPETGRLKNPSNIKTDLRDTECEGVECIHVAQDWGQFLAVMKTDVNPWVPHNADNFLTG